MIGLLEYSKVCCHTTHFQHVGAQSQPDFSSTRIVTGIGSTNKCFLFTFLYRMTGGQLFYFNVLSEILIKSNVSRA